MCELCNEITTSCRQVYFTYKIFIHNKNISCYIQDEMLDKIIRIVDYVITVYLLKNTKI